MSEELISKKDLLELTSISYGQLYRWKRKDLIPEEWFIRKSTFTGQETFFPKEKILERIEKIQTMKDNLSLDDLASMFSSSVTKLSLSKSEVVARGLASEATVSFYLENDEIDIDSLFSFEQVLMIYLIEELLQSGEISLDDAKMILQVTKDYFDKTKQNNGELLLTRKLGISSCIVFSNTSDLIFEKGTKIVIRVDFSKYIEELRTKLL